jgi:hypothetical protein
VACRKGITVVLLSTPKMLMATGFLRQMFEIFERHDTPIDLIATSEVSISVTIDDVEHLADIKADLARLGEVKILRENAIVSLIGRGFFRYQGLSRRIFEALADVNVVMISFRGLRREHLRSSSRKPTPTARCIASIENSSTSRLRSPPRKKKRIKRAPAAGRLPRGGALPR